MITQTETHTNLASPARLICQYHRTHQGIGRSHGCCSHVRSHANLPGDLRQIPPVQPFQCLADLDDQARSLDGGRVPEVAQPEPLCPKRGKRHSDSGSITHA